MDNNHIQNLTDAEIAKLREPTDKYCGVAAHTMARRGNTFSVDVLNAVGNHTDNDGCTVSHIMVRMGYKFSVYDLLELGNSLDLFGCTLAHKMAQKGHIFTVDELIMLGNPRDTTRYTIAHLMTINRGYKFSLDELARLGVEEDHLRYYLRVYDLDLGKVEMRKLRAKIEREKYTEQERDDMVLCLYQEEECRQAVAAGQQPPVEILMARPDLLMEYGGVV